MAKRANKSPFAPLTADAQAKMIRAIGAAKMSATEIAREFGVSRNTVAYHASKAGAKLPKAQAPKAPAKKKAGKARGKKS